MTKGIKNEMLLMVLFFCLTNAISGKTQTKTQTKTDTILCNNKNLIIKYPRISKINIDNYEEGYFKTINCVLDTAIITIHCGSMVNLPLTDLTKKIICSWSFVNYRLHFVIRVVEFVLISTCLMEQHFV